MTRNRHPQLINWLREHNRTTVKEMAKEFSLSPRTVHRDLALLIERGVPLTTQRGKGGGITLAPGYIPDPALLSQVSSIPERREYLSILRPQGEPTIHLRLKIDSSQAARIKREYSEGDWERSETGDFYVNATLSEGPALYEYIFSYGCTAEVLYPNRLRRFMKKQLKQCLKKYI